VAADFAGKTALITGAGRDIGRAIAGGLADAGARVILLARTAAQLDETRALLRGRGAAAAVLEAHTVNLAAELTGTGVTVNAYRPGGVDTAMQAWIRRQDPGRIGAGRHERFNRNYAEGTLITPEHSAAALLAYLAGDDTGAIWDVGSAPVDA
jgi:NAD(P)-dependent dehydrogenase (short-subunit alcohol dehydrogenase family)